MRFSLSGFADIAGGGRIARALLAPMLVIVCAALGGASRENALFVSILELIAIGALFWMLLDPGFEAIPVNARIPIFIWAGFFLLVLVQFVPLPSLVWSIASGRAIIDDGLKELGLSGAWRPLTLAPEQTLALLLGALPPFAIFIATLKAPARRGVSASKWIVPILGLTSTALGFLQVMDSSGAQLYFFETVAKGWPSGFFANPNHQALFLAMCLPFTGALAGHLRQRYLSGDGAFEQIVFAGLIAVLLVIGILVAGSIAGYVLLAPVLIASFFIAAGGSAKHGSRLSALSVIGVFAVLGAIMASSPFVINAGGSLEEKALLARPQLWGVTLNAIWDHFPYGVGFGVFPELFPLYEDPNSVGRVFAPRAHNDYLEILLESGLLGGALMLAVLGWWAMRSADIWTSGPSLDWRLRKAASVALGAMFLHSVVDYPGRTLAIAGLAAFCAAIMVGAAPRPAAQEKNVAQGGDLVL